jgi:hypothetical protein
MNEVYNTDTTAVVKIKTGESVTSVKVYQSTWTNDRIPADAEFAVTHSVVSGSPYDDIVVDLPPTLKPADFYIVVVTGVSTYRETFTLVHPYATVDQIAEAAKVQYTDPLADNYKPLATIRQMESLARAVIDAQTGHNFGQWYAAYDMPGTDTRIIYSQHPVLDVDLVRTHDDILLGPAVANVEFAITPSGHGVEVFEDDVYYGFPEGYKYQVVGTYGYNYVPNDINHAAILIASTYLCSAASYWNRYIEQTKFGESQAKFNRLAFAGTGNAAADIILNKYQFHKYFVI